MNTSEVERRDRGCTPELRKPSAAGYLRIVSRHANGTHHRVEWTLDAARGGGLSTAFLLTALETALNGGLLADDAERLALREARYDTRIVTVHWLSPRADIIHVDEWPRELLQVISKHAAAKAVRRLKGKEIQIRKTN